MKVLGLSASVLAGGYRYNLITLVRGSHNFTSMDGKSNQYRDTSPLVGGSAIPVA